MQGQVKARRSGHEFMQPTACPNYDRSQVLTDLALVAPLGIVLAACSHAYCALQGPDMLEDQCNALAVAEPGRLTHTCIEQPLYVLCSEQ